MKRVGNEGGELTGPPAAAPPDTRYRYEMWIGIGNEGKDATYAENFQQKFGSQEFRIQFRQIFGFSVCKRCQMGILGSLKSTKLV